MARAWRLPVSKYGAGAARRSAGNPFRLLALASLVLLLALPLQVAF